MNMELENCEQLLLSYTYFINADHSKYISVGYSVDNFTPCVIVNYIGIAKIKLVLLEWLNIFLLKNEDISSFFSSCGSKKPKNSIKTLKNTKIQFDAASKSVIINGLAINHEEWTLMLQMTDYIQSVLYWCRQSTREVSSYYNEYVKRCCEQNVYSLDATHFFSDISSIKCNYTRLFWEIPILCREKLMNDVNNYYYCNEFLKFQ